MARLYGILTVSKFNPESFPISGSPLSRGVSKLKAPRPTDVKRSIWFLALARNLEAITPPGKTLHPWPKLFLMSFKCRCICGEHVSNWSCISEHFPLDKGGSRAWPKEAQPSGRFSASPTFAAFAFGLFQIFGGLGIKRKPPNNISNMARQISGRILLILPQTKNPQRTNLHRINHLLSPGSVEALVYQIGRIQ